MAITYEETVQTLLNLLQEKAQLQKRVAELEKELEALKARHEAAEGSS